MAIGDQASNNGNERVDRAAMASVFDLRNVLELVNHAFNDGTCTKQEVVHPRHQSVVHLLAEFGNELKVESLQKLLNQSLGKVATICDQLAEQPFAQIGHWCAVVGASWRDRTSQQFFTPVIDHRMQFEAVKPAHRTFATVSQASKDLVVKVVTYAQSR